MWSRGRCGGGVGINDIVGVSGDSVAARYLTERLSSFLFKLLTCPPEGSDDETFYNRCEILFNLRSIDRDTYVRFGNH